MKKIIQFTNPYEGLYNKDDLLSVNKLQEYLGLSKGKQKKSYKFMDFRLYIKTEDCMQLSRKLTNGVNKTLTNTME